jgi:hypothetical protein
MRPSCRNEEDISLVKDDFVTVLKCQFELGK